MKVCVWSGASFEEWYSSYHLMLKIIQELLDAGHEVWLVQVQRTTGAVPDVVKDAKNLHVINVKQEMTAKGNFVKRYINGFQYYWESSKIVKDLKYIDVILLQSNNNAIIPVTVARNLHIPIVYNVQDIFPIDALVIGKLSRFNPAFVFSRMLQAKAYCDATRVITISEDLARTIRKEGRLDVDVIYNWSYQNEPYNIPDDKNHFLLANNISRKDGFRVIYAGNVGQMMENETIVQAARILKDYEDIKFYIIGTGSGLKRLKERVQEEKLKNILFYDFQPMEYAPHNYCAADININPVPKGVIYTCMPSKTATCLLSEKPTIVTMDLDSDMAKKLSTVDQWSVVAPGDAKAMSDAIIKVYKNGSLKSKNAAKFLQDLGPVENARQYVKILEESCSKN